MPVPQGTLVFVKEKKRKSSEHKNVFIFAIPFFLIKIPELYYLILNTSLTSTNFSLLCSHIRLACQAISSQAHFLVCKVIENKITNKIYKKYLK